MHNNRQVAFFLRAYNEAAAVRSELRGTGSTTVTGEVTGFTIASGTGGDIPPAATKRPSISSPSAPAAVSLAIPILFKTASNAWALVTEAAVYGDYTGIKFSSKTASKNVYQVAFPTVRGRYPVRCRGNFPGVWRLSETRSGRSLNLRSWKTSILPASLRI